MPHEGIEKRVYAYTPNGKYVGYVRIGQDDSGFWVGEVYNTEADRLGAVRCEIFDTDTTESIVYEPDGAQIGYVRMEADEDGMHNADIVWTGRRDQEEQVMASISYRSGDDSERIPVHKGDDSGEIGSLKPENVNDEELVLLGGGAALLLLM